MTKPPTRLAHLPQLDSLRVFAVGGVMVHHWLDEPFGLPLGGLGVQLFFVLSGFLITGILLRARAAAEATALPAFQPIKNFYFRRFVRIFPLFYMTIAVTWVLDRPDVRDSLVWNLTYTSNFYIARLGYWPVSISHFWSLAVEEQFYLLWPFIVMFTPRKRLLPVLIAIAAIGPVYRLGGALLGLSFGQYWLWFYTMPFASVDSLALGGALALVSTPGYESPVLRAKLVKVGLWAGLPLTIVLWQISYNSVSIPGLPIIEKGFDNTAWALLFVWLIGGAARGFGGWAGWILELRPLLYLGKISYGLYVIHVFMRPLVAWLCEILALPYPTTGLGKFSVLAAATVAVSACSWHLYEKPLNDLKERFSYTGPERKVVLGSAARHDRVLPLEPALEPGRHLAVKNAEEV